MRFFRLMLAVSVLLAMLAATAVGAPFVLFPKTGELRSPDGRLAVRNAERHGSAADIVVIDAQSLWLVEVTTGRSRKLCNYLGVAAVAWSGNDFVVVTEYVGKRTSRAWLFPVVGPYDDVMLDKPTLTHSVPIEFRETFRQNDHVFVEAVSVQDGALLFRVWGYGARNAAGFRLQCEYALREKQITCKSATQQF
jgi:hypothetical protein